MQQGTPQIVVYKNNWWIRWKLTSSDARNSQQLFRFENTYHDFFPRQDKYEQEPIATNNPARIGKNKLQWQNLNNSILKILMK